MAYKNPEDRRRYWKGWYSNPVNRRKHIKRNRKLAQTRRVEIMNWVREYKVKHGCIDCGYNRHHIALDLDHRNRKTKRASVSEMVRNFNSLEAVKKEIAKCDVRCSNCHRIKHFERA